METTGGDREGPGATERMLDGAELRLAALLYPKLALDGETYARVRREIDSAGEAGTLGPDEGDFLKAFLVCVPTRDARSPTTPGEEDDWPTPVSGFQVFGEWKGIDPDDPIWKGAFGAGEAATLSDWLDYAYDSVPSVAVHRRLMDEDVRESTGAFQTLLELSLRDRDVICAADWRRIVEWVQSGHAAAFRPKLQSALRLAERAGADRAIEAAELLHREIVGMGLDRTSELESDLVDNRVETTLGIVIGFIPLIGPLFTGALGATKEKEIQAEKRRVQWMELIEDIDSLRNDALDHRSQSRTPRPPDASGSASPS